jgi:dTMP kinase
MGLFISIEGIDGCGKSSVSECVAEILEEKGIGCLLTREPGGCETAEKIRSIITQNDGLSNIATLMLFNAARAENLEKKIKRSLNEGKIVVCDRFIYSTVVYQSILNNIDEKTIMDIHKIAFNNIMPDMTFVLDCNIIISNGRLKMRQQEESFFDKESDDNKQKMRDKFLEIADKNDDVFVVDASKGIYSISQKIVSIIEEKLKD